MRSSVDLGLIVFSYLAFASLKFYANFFKSLLFKFDPTFRQNTSCQSLDPDIDLNKYSYQLARTC